jgi:hypothetical protein
MSLVGPITAIPNYGDSALNSRCSHAEAGGGLWDTSGTDQGIAFASRTPSTELRDCATLAGMGYILGAGVTGTVPVVGSSLA